MADSHLVNQNHNSNVLIKHFSVPPRIAQDVLLVDNEIFSGHPNGMDPKIFNQELGLLLQKLRAENRMTQSELARRTGISRASIANMETGRQAMSAYQAYLVSEALQLRNLNALFPAPKVDTELVEMNLNGSSELNDIQRRQVESVIARANI